MLTRETLSWLEIHRSWEAQNLTTHLALIIEHKLLRLLHAASQGFEVQQTYVHTLCFVRKCFARVHPSWDWSSQTRLAKVTPEKWGLNKSSVADTALFEPAQAARGRGKQQCSTR